MDTSLWFGDLPAELSGVAGSNRERNRVNQTGAQTDLQAIQSFLDLYVSRTETLRSYTREIRRFCWWAYAVQHKPISSLSGSDARAYQAFLCNPSEDWCGPANRAYDAPQKPFRGPLRATSQRTAIAVLNSLFNYLVEAGYLSSSPFSVVRAGKHPLAERKASAQRRILPHAAWMYVIEHLETQPSTFQCERDKFMVSFMFLLALRVSEASQAVMEDFQQVRGRWMFRVVGKGQKLAYVPVPPDLVVALQRWRAVRYLPGMPVVGDKQPVLCSHVGKRLTSRYIGMLIEQLMHSVAKSVPDNSIAELLRSVSCHWLRHTSISRQVEAGIPVFYVKENARHSSLRTTEIYIHTEEDLRHEQTQRLTLK